MKNYYEILEVNVNASQEVIEKAYRVLAKKYHPDAWPSNQSYWAEDRFKEVTEAYQTLSNPTLRMEYNIKIGINNNDDIKHNYDNLYAENEKLKQEVNSMKIKNKSKEYTDKKNQNFDNITPQTYFKRYSSTIKELISSEVNKSQEERSKDLKALIITIVIVAILIFVFWKVPFLHSLIFP